MGLGYQVTAEDVEAILKRHALYVANTGGVSFSAMAEQLLAAGYIDEEVVEQVALAAGTGEDDEAWSAEQTKAANVEIVRQLCEAGVFDRHDITDLEAQFQSSTSSAVLNENAFVIFAESQSGPSELTGFWSRNDGWGPQHVATRFAKDLDGADPRAKQALSSVDDAVFVPADLAAKLAKAIEVIGAGVDSEGDDVSISNGHGQSGELVVRSPANGARHEMVARWSLDKTTVTAFEVDAKGVCSELGSFEWADEYVGSSPGDHLFEAFEAMELAERANGLAIAQLESAARQAMGADAVLNEFSVLFVEKRTGKIGMRHALAHDGMAAIAAVAKQCPGVEFVAAVPGKLTEAAGLVFPGESLVSSETVLEQPDVFGEPDQGTVFPVRSDVSFEM